MKTTQMIRGSGIPIFLILMLFWGCAAKKNIWGDPKAGFNLEYRMPEKGKLQYDLNADYVQAMEVMGQKLDLTTNSKNLFSMTPAGRENGNYKLNVTIDTVFIQIKSPTGDIMPSMAGVIGKEFVYVVTPHGEEIDYSGAEELKYTLGEYEDLDISSDFKALFPDLPVRPIRVGESWTSIDTVDENSSSGNLQIISTHAHLVEGIEVFNGYHCLKIHSTFAGTLSGSGAIQGVTTKTTGTIEGEDIWYFAYENGLFIKITTTGQAKSTTEAKREDRDVIIPSTRDFTIVTELVR